MENRQQFSMVGKGRIFSDLKADDFNTLNGNDIYYFDEFENRSKDSACNMSDFKVDHASLKHAKHHEWRVKQVQIKPCDSTRLQRLRMEMALVAS